MKIFSEISYVRISAAISGKYYERIHGGIPAEISRGVCELLQDSLKGFKKKTLEESLKESIDFPKHTMLKFP